VELWYVKFTLHYSENTRFWSIYPPECIYYFCSSSVPSFTRDRNHTLSDSRSLKTIVLYWLFINWKESLGSLLSFMHMLLKICKTKGEVYVVQYCMSSYTKNAHSWLVMRTNIQWFTEVNCSLLMVEVLRHDCRLAKLCSNRML
jgi:hypothetical protein